MIQISYFICRDQRNIGCEYPEHRPVDDHPQTRSQLLVDGVAKVYGTGNRVGSRSGYHSGDVWQSNESADAEEGKHEGLLEVDQLGRRVKLNATVVDVVPDSLHKEPIVAASAGNQNGDRLVTGRSGSGWQRGRRPSPRVVQQGSADSPADLMSNVLHCRAQKISDRENLQNVLYC